MIDTGATQMREEAEAEEGVDKPLATLLEEAAPVFEHMVLEWAARSTLKISSTCSLGEEWAMVSEGVLQRFHLVDRLVSGRVTLPNDLSRHEEQEQEEMQLSKSTLQCFFNCCRSSSWVYLASFPTHHHSLVHPTRTSLGSPRVFIDSRGQHQHTK